MRPRRNRHRVSDDLGVLRGQGTKVFPQWIRDTGVLPVPMLIVLVLMLYRRWRVLLAKSWRDA